MLVFSSSTRIGVDMLISQNRSWCYSTGRARSNRSRTACPELSMKWNTLLVATGVSSLTQSSRLVELQRHRDGRSPYPPR